MYPEGFLKLYAAAEVDNIHEGLIILLHSILLEVGFTPKNINEDSVYDGMPEHWKVKGFFKFQYSHKSVKDSHCLVDYVSLYSNIAIYGKLQNAESPTQTVHLNMLLNNYVDSKADMSNPTELFPAPDELSRFFKDNFCFPLIAIIQESEGCKSYFGLGYLVEDIKLFLFKLLPVESVVALSCVNKDFRNAGNSSELWEYLFCRDFGSETSDPSVSSDTDWKRKYIIEYISRRQLREQSNSIPFDDFSEYYPTGPPHIFIDPSVSLDPDLQIAFPNLLSRFRRNDIFDSIHYGFY